MRDLNIYYSAKIWKQPKILKEKYISIHTPIYRHRFRYRYIKPIKHLLLHPFSSTSLLIGRCCQYHEDTASVEMHLGKCMLHCRLPLWLSGKESACNSGASGDTGSISGSGSSPGGGNVNSLQYSYLGNPIDRGDWWGLQSIVLPRVRHNWRDLAHTCSILIIPLPERNLLQNKLPTCIGSPLCTCSCISMKNFWI